MAEGRDGRIFPSRLRTTRVLNRAKGEHFEALSGLILFVCWKQSRRFGRERLWLGWSWLLDRSCDSLGDLCTMFRRPCLTWEEKKEEKNRMGMMTC